MILYIPLPLLWRIHLPLHKKLIYGVWLCFGIFIVPATLLRCILCLQDISQINVGTIWSIRETVRNVLNHFHTRKKCGLITPHKSVCWYCGCQSSSPKAIRLKSKKAVSSGRSSRRQESSSGVGVPDRYRLSFVDRFGKKRTVHALTTLGNSSEEHIIEERVTHQNGGVENQYSGTESMVGREGSAEREIVVTKSYMVTSKLTDHKATNSKINQHHIFQPEEKISC